LARTLRERDSFLSGCAPIGRRCASQAGSRELGKKEAATERGLFHGTCAIKSISSVTLNLIADPLAGAPIAEIGRVAGRLSGCAVTEVGRATNLPGARAVAVVYCAADTLRGRAIVPKGRISSLLARNTIIALDSVADGLAILGLAAICKKDDDSQSG
jgi:hypothetical protein